MRGQGIVIRSSDFIARLWEVSDLVALLEDDERGLEKSGVSKLSDAVLCSDLSAMAEAINAGANVNEVDREHKMTPLLWAILRGDIEAVRLLLNSGADPNLTS
jgi:ankyrin repeat protein